MAESWHLNGKVLVACNCDWGCPCNFNARPTTGKCEGGWTWHIEEGAYGDIKLHGLSFSVYVNWPGAIHEGNGEALVLIDSRADAAQRSEEHTSELQSLAYLVCRLLLEKKKNKLCDVI